MLAAIIATVISVNTVPIEHKIANEEPINYNLSNDQNVINTNHKFNNIIPGVSFVDREKLRVEQEAKAARELAEKNRRASSREVIARDSSVRNGQRAEGIAYCQTLWSAADCEKLDYIVMHESSWVVGIPNGEGCAGIGQACPASKMGEYAGTLEGETLWTMIYCQSYNRGAYKGIDGAYRHKIDFGWY